MTVGAWIYSRENGRQRYELTDFLGSGAIGGVYRGRGDDRSEIAVKVPHARLPADLELRFWQELAVLNKVGEISQGRYFPRAWRGALADTGREVLCMELVRGERLVKLAENNGGALDEKLALDAGLPYARMLEILHTAEISCPDRKADDLYWDTATQRLTVLDWNVVKQGSGSMDPLQDLYIFGSLWYQFMTGGLPSPVDERIRRPLEGHPNWDKISYGLQMILRKALSPDSQWRYQNSEELRKAIEQQRDDFIRSANDLLRDAQVWLQKAKAPYGAGMEALYKAEGARFYNEREAEQNLQLSVTHIRDLQKSRDEALRLADLARRRQVGGAEGVWIEAQDLRRGLLELVQNGSRRVRMVQYTAALQWLEVAEQAVAEDRSEILKLRRWQTLADAGQVAIARDLSLKQVLDPLAEIVEALEQGQTSSASGMWQRLTPKLDAAGWRETEPASRHLRSLGHEVAAWQAWELAQRAVDDGQYEQAAQCLDQVAKEADSIVYAQRLLAVLGHTSKSLVDAAKELHGRAKVEESANRLLKAGTDLLNDGDFSGAATRLQEGLAVLAGKSGTKRLRQQMEYALRLAGWLPKLDGVLHALPEPDSALEGRIRDWHDALDILERLAGEQARESIVRQRVRLVIEQAYTELDRIRKASPSPPTSETGGRSSFLGIGGRTPLAKDWQSVASADRAQRIKTLLNRFQELYRGPGSAWLDAVMQGSDW